MKLEELIPSLELCKKIPTGEFADSAFCWVDEGRACVLPDGVIQPERHPFVELRRYTIQGDEIPAPTLQEIIVEIDNLGGWCPTAYRLQNSWTVDYQEDNEDGLNDVVEQSDLDNPATAALKLWLELKGENK